ncbi:CHAT domain-containing protein [Candidatus Uabimicrobium amorphum]|uniref:CHAT domain-containing protein n=1 Tax=Uabimicrobium amorphum TaxID=2596890 RepID=A0A5S9IQH6_UABAM|nr:CHAT domain-containing protein [Candidatus Uabimicrobium amorphum]BBM86238.1 hypothetical protein UABAM_04624 [Candidatus Uabimicrobium amorphum]
MRFSPELFIPRGTILGRSKQAFQILFKHFPVFFIVPFATIFVFSCVDHCISWYLVGGSKSAYAAVTSWADQEYFHKTENITTSMAVTTKLFLYIYNFLLYGFVAYFFTVCYVSLVYKKSETEIIPVTMKECLPFAQQKVSKYIGMYLYLAYKILLFPTLLLLLRFALLFLPIPRILTQPLDFVFILGCFYLIVKGIERYPLSVYIAIAKDEKYKEAAKKSRKFMASKLRETIYIKAFLFFLISEIPFLVFCYRNLDIFLALLKRGRLSHFMSFLSSLDWALLLFSIVSFFVIITLTIFSFIKASNEEREKTLSPIPIESLLTMSILATVGIVFPIIRQHINTILQPQNLEEKYYMYSPFGSATLLETFAISCAMGAFIGLSIICNYLTLQRFSKNPHLVRKEAAEGFLTWGKSLVAAVLVMAIVAGLDFLSTMAKETAENPEFISQKADMKKKERLKELEISKTAREFFNNGNYAKAEPLLREIVDSYRKKQDMSLEDAIVFSGHINLIGEILEHKGDYEKATEFFSEALEIRKTRCGANHSSVAASLNHLGIIKYKLKKYEASADLLRQAIKINEKNLGTDHTNVVEGFSFLADALSKSKKYDEAEKLLYQAFQIRSKFFQMRSMPEKQNSSKSQKFEMVFEIMKSFASVGGIDVPEYETRDTEKIKLKKGGEYPKSPAKLANSMMQLAIFLRDHRKQYHKAEELMKKAIEIYENTIGGSHYLTGKAMKEMAITMLAMDKKEAYQVLKKSSTISNKNLTLIFPSLTERQQERYLETQVRDDIDTYLSAFKDIFIYKEVLNYRGIVARTLRDRTLAIRKPEIAKLYLKLSEARRLYANVYLNPDGNEEQRKKLFDDKEQLERQMNRQLYRQTSTQNLQNLRKVVRADNSVVVDFVVYNKTTNWQKRKATPALAAFVLEGDKINRIEFKSLKRILRGIEAFRQQLTTGRQIIISKKTADEYLYRYLWKPLEKYINKKKVYIVPDGDISLVPFAALSTQKNRYLIEQLDISYLSSAYDLLENKDNNKFENEGLLCIGNVAYDLAPKADSTSQVNMFSRRAKSQATWNELPGAAKETQKIVKTFKDYFSQQVVYLKREHASEANFFTYSPKKRFIHLATHGFFNSPTLKTDGIGNTRKGTQIWVNFGKKTKIESLPAGVNPLLYSGIVMAGANIKGKKSDGIITAEELAGFDLRGTELLVLSACETGLGVRMRGQGISGLRLAAQIAGVRAMLVSLWPVDDLGTQKFMQYFYQKLWQEKKSRSQALQETCQKWIEQFKNAEDINQQKIYTSRVWAAFILSGEK